MATRRVSDTRQPPRPVLPPTAPPKKSAKRAPTAAAPAAAIPVAAAPKSSKRRTTGGKTPAGTSAKTAPAVTPDERRGMIARAAYLRAQSRGFGVDSEVQDWLAAEKEIDALLSAGHLAPQ
jgi:hypothetical protein